MKFKTKLLQIMIMINILLLKNLIIQHHKILLQDLKNLNKNVTSDKPKHIFVENELNKQNQKKLKQYQQID